MKEAHFGTVLGCPRGVTSACMTGMRLVAIPRRTEFFAQVSRVIAVCLGLALLANVVVSAIGAQ